MRHHVRIGPERELRRVFPCLLAVPVEDPVQRLPVVECLITVGHRSPNRG